MSFARDRHAMSFARDRHAMSFAREPACSAQLTTARAELASVIVCDCRARRQRHHMRTAAAGHDAAARLPPTAPARLRSGAMAAQ